MIMINELSIKFSSRHAVTKLRGLNLPEMDQFCLKNQGNLHLRRQGTVEYVTDLTTAGAGGVTASYAARPLSCEGAVNGISVLLEQDKLVMKRGYMIVDPGLALPQVGLDDDSQVRCLSYIAKNLDSIISIPNELRVAIIPAQYLGPPYPAIGLFTDVDPYDYAGLTHFSFVLAETIRKHIEDISLAKLVNDSSEEPITWKEVLDSSGVEVT